MIYYKATLTSLALAICIVGCASDRDRVLEAAAYAERGDCNGGEIYASKNITGAAFYVAMGAIAESCRHNRNAAIQYFKSAARMGDKFSVDTLIQWGETPPEPTRQVIIQQAPPQQAQQIIIQQGGGDPNPFPNMNKCIKDGGTLMCR